MIAVPCWSSWKTGMPIRAFSRSSTSKHSGALMSSRLMPPKVGSSAEIVSTMRSMSGRVDLDVEDVDAGELLEQHRLAFHHRLGGERADIAEAEHGRAVGDRRRPDWRAPCSRRRSPDRRGSRGRARRRPANRRAPGRAGCRAAWSPGSRAFRGSDTCGSRARPRRGRSVPFLSCRLPCGLPACALSRSSMRRFSRCQMTQPHHRRTNAECQCLDNFCNAVRRDQNALT